MSGKRYTEEFKIDAVRQVVERGYSVAEVASRLGMTMHSLKCLGDEVRPRFGGTPEEDCH